MVRIDDVQKLGKDNMDATLKSFGAFSKSLQAITVEIADYSKKVFEQSTAATEKLLGAKSFEKAIEVQSEPGRGTKFTVMVNVCISETGAVIVIVPPRRVP